MSTFKRLPTDLSIDENAIFRPRAAYQYFGFGHSQLYQKIKSGEIEPPFPLSESGSAVGWTGRMIIEHHRKRLALQEKRRAG
jgi:predicted DNA-binding transcriptional regulator AlpA